MYGTTPTPRSRKPGRLIELARIHGQALADAKALATAKARRRARKLARPRSVGVADQAELELDEARTRGITPRVYGPGDARREGDR